MKNFNELGLSNSLLKKLSEMDFREPSEIQRKAIPPILAGKDVIAGSATGSGKTLVFGAAIVDRLKKGHGLQALILTPTRELAEQVSTSLNEFSKYAPLEIIPVYGGVSINLQIKQLRTADVVVGTPGRILDHLSRGTIDLKHIKILVLDEADRMLDMGFLPAVENILQECPEKRQTILLSATVYEDLSSLAERYMINPAHVSAESQVDPSKLRQVYYDVPSKMKFSLLVYLLKKEQANLLMVFCNTRINADFVGKNLKYSGIDAVAIHGGLAQNRRKNIMWNFHKGKVCVLVCTDVAARGLDIPNVTHIYNYDLPKTSKEYIHRIGRTARAGKEGIAVNLVSQRDYENFGRILSDYSLDIAEEKLPNMPPVKVQLFDRRGGHDRNERGFSREGGAQGNRPGRYKRPNKSGGFGRSGPSRSFRKVYK